MAFSGSKSTVLLFDGIFTARQQDYIASPCGVAVGNYNYSYIHVLHKNSFDNNSCFPIIIANPSTF